MLNLAWRADTVVRGVAIVAAGTRVHGGYKHETTRIFHIILSTTDAYLTVFQRLAQYFKDTARQLRHFIQKEHPIVCQADFTRLWIIASTHQSHLRNGVVRRSERALTDEAGVTIQLSCHTVNLSGFQAFCQRQRGKNARKAFGHHRLTTAWRTYHNEVMSTSCCYFKGSLHTLLSTNIAEVQFVVVLLFKELLASIDNGWFVGSVAIQKLHHVHQRFHAVNLQLVDNGSFANVLLGNYQSLELLGAGSDGNG